MNVGATSREAIMETCRNIVANDGLSALNMRTVADHCHIALGTLYNYYSDKSSLLIATVESVWMDIFHMEKKCESSSFPEYVEQLFESVKKGIRKYPDFFAAHAISVSSSEKGRAINAMSGYFSNLEHELMQILDNDPASDRNVFSDSFKESAFIDFVVETILILLVREKNDCSTLTEIIRRIIYH